MAHRILIFSSIYIVKFEIFFHKANFDKQFFSLFLNGIIIIYFELNTVIRRKHNAKHIFDFYLNKN